VEWLRNYVCPHCDTSAGNREMAVKRLNDWLQRRPPQPEAGSGFKFREGRKNHRASSAWAASNGCRSGMKWSSVSPDQSQERALVGE
jgi:hypothetical protein